MRVRNAVLAIAALVSIALGVHAQPASIEQHGDKAACCNPEIEGIDSRALLELAEWIRNRRPPVYSILISRNGRLLFELYGSGVTRQHAHYLMSVTKSFVSALVGITIDDRLVAGPDAPITDTLPRALFASDADVARFRSVTVRDVLGMSALDAPDPPRSYAPEALARQKLFWSSRSRVKLALEQPVLSGHGRNYQYNDLTPMLATGLVQYATGKTALEFAELRLFKPMEFANYEWMHQDPSGVDNGGYGLRLRPIDMQKFGLLYLNRGAWRGKALISERWVRTSFSPWNRTGWDLRYPDYGWFWWTYDAGPGWLGLYANGWKGQRIAIFPDQKIVLTMTACIEDGSERRVFEQVVGLVARATRRNTPLPESAEARSRLAAVLDELRALPLASCPGGGARMIPSISAKGKRVPFHP